MLVDRPRADILSIENVGNMDQALTDAREVNPDLESFMTLAQTEKSRSGWHDFPRGWSPGGAGA